MTRDSKYLYHDYMDQKKQALTPELKEIYDRVMNTQVAAPPQPQPVTPPTVMGATQPPQSPQPVISPTTTQVPPIQNEGFLSSVPPRPLTDTKSFVFTGNKVTTTDKQSTTQAPLAASKKMSNKIIAIIVGAIIIMWAVLWAMIFGLF